MWSRGSDSVPLGFIVPIGQVKPITFPSQDCSEHQRSSHLKSLGLTTVEPGAHSAHQRPLVTIGSGWGNGRKSEQGWSCSRCTCPRCGAPEGMTGRTRVWAHSYQAGVPSSHSACHSASPHSNTMMKVWPSRLYKEGNESWGQIPFPRSTGTSTVFRKAWGVFNREWVMTGVFSIAPGRGRERSTPGHWWAGAAQAVQ